MADLGKTQPKFLFVTNNYHVLQTSFYARKLGLDAEGLGSKTAGYYIPTAFVREYAAILAKLKVPLAALTFLLLAFIIASFVMG